MPKRRMRRRERPLRILIDVDPGLSVESVQTLAKMIIYQHGKWITDVHVTSVIPENVSV